jgi:hypothetical protein
MVNSEELIGTTDYLTLYTRCHINRCRYNRVRLYNVFLRRTLSAELLGMISESSEISMYS